MALRENKARVIRALKSPHWEEEFRSLAASHPQRLVSPLFGALCSASPYVKWHAVTCFGLTASRIADHSLERVRVIMRRFLWSLNDESGGIGWGAPEAMAEVMAGLDRMAEEYHRLLFSFVRPMSGPDNYLEMSSLREGAYWGAARLGQSRPDLLAPYSDLFVQAMQAETSLFARGCICLALQAASPGDEQSRQALLAAAEEKTAFALYWNKSFQQTSLAELAAGALQQ